MITSKESLIKFGEHLIQPNMTNRKIELKDTVMGRREMEEGGRQREHKTKSIVSNKKCNKKKLL